MRKAILLTAAAAFLAVPAVLQAQERATVDVVAEVIQGLTVSPETEGELNFRDFVVGTAETRHIDGDSGGDLLSITVSGAPGREVTFGWGANVALTLDGSGAGTSLVYTPAMYDGDDGGSPLQPAEAVTLTGGSATFYLGGSLAVPDNAGVGNYEGSIEVDFEYVNL
jgi:hypothetical protein